MHFSASHILVAISIAAHTILPVAAQYSDEDEAFELGIRDAFPEFDAYLEESLLLEARDGGDLNDVAGTVSTLAGHATFPHSVKGSVVAGTVGAIAGAAHRNGWGRIKASLPATVPHTPQQHRVAAVAAAAAAAAKSQNDRKEMKEKISQASNSQMGLTKFQQNSLAALRGRDLLDMLDDEDLWDF